MEWRSSSWWLPGAEEPRDGGRMGSLDLVSGPVVVNEFRGGAAARLGG